MKWRTYGDYIPDDGLCLVKTDDGSLDIRSYTNCHHDWDGAYSGRVVKYLELRDLDEVLSGNADNDMRCNFARTLCEIAIPALEKWLTNCVSHPSDLSEEEWETTLTKILESFKESKRILDGEYDKLPPEVFRKRCNKVLHLRAEAFTMMAIHFLDMWD